MTKRDENNAKIKRGDGSAIKPVRGLEALWRSQFGIRLVEQDGNGRDAVRSYAVDVNLFDWEPTGALYRDGQQYLRAELPVRFPVQRGEIDVAATSFGMKRVHFIRDNEEVQLLPMPGTAEHARAMFAREHPFWSRLIGILAIVVMLVSLALLVPWALEQVTRVEFIAERFGVFVSPLEIPGWLGGVLTVAGFAAAIERALTLRNHWLIDADTWFLGD
ncbi:hypothetical protein [Gulosibacter molinativorax]|uniref:DUF2812 domain-containing protein n=1 Tax=Gulosibacter molinativorax TaxID=256821 RepID=A0ABT7CAT2_9MICO|nr:hypothetical protein [Gulosibacter molinativorax]MDJ1372272.1 hypothetical protein [Gulosibacter molinativorax]QUY63443.1 Hypothetical protein GMOLON4_2766 [Gulosibacter molinativorax]